jgi:capsular exopolysaccharide synthesis family protein
LKAKNENLSIIDFYNPESPESTEFRRILRRLTGPGADTEKKSILITSSTLAEGKSIIASFLALTAATSGRKKTLLIDFDLRRPMVNRLFGISLNKGVSNILTEGAATRNIVKKSSVDNLDILTAGKVISNPSEFFNAAIIHRIIDEMKFYYDLILVDAPPLVPVVDPMIILEELDGALLVVKAGATSRDIIRRER